MINRPSSFYSWRFFVFKKKKNSKKVNFDKECVECKWCGFYNVFNRFHCSIELWRMVMNQVGRKNFVEKPPTFVPLGKSPVMRAIFAGPLLTPLFSRAAFSWRLVCESLPWEWAHGSFFCLCLGSFLWHLSLRGLGFLASMKIGRRVLVIVFCVDENRRRKDISDILKRSEMTSNAIWPCVIPILVQSSMFSSLRKFHGANSNTNGYDKKMRNSTAAVFLALLLMLLMLSLL